MFYQLMFAYLSQGLVNKFRRQPQNKRKLYCENNAFEDECSYVEEIDRSVSNLAEDALHPIIHPESWPGKADSARNDFDQE